MVVGVGLVLGKTDKVADTGCMGERLDKSKK